MWALGLNMLDALGGSRPDKHTAFLTDTDYIAERAKGKRLPSYLQYLANLQSDPVPYAEQVHDAC